MKQYLAIDLGGTAIKYSLINEDGTGLSPQSIPTPKDSMESLYHSLDSIVLPVKDSISGIAVSFPGRIDNIIGHIFTGGAVASYMTNVPFKDLLEQRYQLPVSIENDGKCAAQAELWKGSLKEAHSGAVIIIGYAIGGGIILNNQLYRGTHGSSGEFSTIITDYDFNHSPVFWADICGVGGLLKPYAQVKQIPLDQVNGHLFFEALQHNDSDAQRIYQTYLKRMRSGILTLQSILDVEKYCIGGGISSQNRLIEDIRQSINDYFDTAPNYIAMIRPQIEHCQFKNDANLIGALKNFIDIYG